jgi:hypothetical protein
VKKVFALTVAANLPSSNQVCRADTCSSDWAWSSDWWWSNRSIEYGNSLPTYTQAGCPDRWRSQHQNGHSGAWYWRKNDR